MASQLEDLLPRYKHVLKAHLHMTQIRIIGLNKPPNHALKNSIFSLTSSIWTGYGCCDVWTQTGVQ